MRYKGRAGAHAKPAPAHAAAQQAAATGSLPLERCGHASPAPPRPQPVAEGRGRCERGVHCAARSLVDVDAVHPRRAPFASLWHHHEQLGAVVVSHHRIAELRASRPPAAVSGAAPMRSPGQQQGRAVGPGSGEPASAFLCEPAWSALGAIGATTQRAYSVRQGLIWARIARAGGSRRGPATAAAA
jgi:hypothetical protein